VVVLGAANLEDAVPPCVNESGVADGYWLELPGGFAEEGRDGDFAGKSESDDSILRTGRMRESPATGLGEEVSPSPAASKKSLSVAAPSHAGRSEDEPLSCSLCSASTNSAADW
jgi:hypothetical protein